MKVTPTKKKGQRVANYSTEEDVALIMAWEIVTLNIAIGTNQNSSTYWKCIVEHFHRNVKTPSNRTIGSLQHRWSSIQECYNKWTGCIEVIHRQHPSGVPIQELELYKQKDKQKHKPFTMLRCWNLLQHNEKWVHRNGECAPKRPKSSNSSTPEFNFEEEEKMMRKRVEVPLLSRLL